MPSRRLLGLYTVLIGCGIGLCAQSSAPYGELSGRVTDPSGAAVPQAQVTATNVETGFTVSSPTGESGEYHILLLPPSTYEIKVEREGFSSQVKKGIQVSVRQIAVVDFRLELGAIRLVVEVSEKAPLIEPERSHQATTIGEVYIRQLPIDRRDYLSYALLAPAVTDADALADANDFRAVQTAHSGLSFFGNNGRGNSVTVDGGEIDDAGGGIRPNLSQEAIQEFQINRAGYSAEFGAASGGVINIVSKSGANFFKGSAFAFFRHDRLDAADPFAKTLVDNQVRRVDPSSRRQQFGGTFGGPVRLNRSFFFAAFEGLERDESNSVSVLTDPSIFEPTPAQLAILSRLPEAQAAVLRQRLTSPPLTRELFQVNSGVFPFTSGDYKFSLRFDHQAAERDQLVFRYNYANIDETNPNTRALVGISRGIETSELDHNGLLRWTHQFSPRLINQASLQFNYDTLFVTTSEKHGPEFNIEGFGLFNRDIFLPSRNISRRFQFLDGLSIHSGSHLLNIGGQVLIRGTLSESHALLGGRFTFGPLPGAALTPALASTTITALQAFNLGLPQFFQQGFGEPTVGSTDPFYAVYVQDRWKVTRNLILDLGMRYEVDLRKEPVPTDTNNFAPRIGFAWDPGGNHKTTIRGGYGIFYSPTYYFVDWVANALNDLNGRRQIAQMFTILDPRSPASAAVLFNTLRAQGVITLPFPTRSITAEDLKQFGLQVRHEGPVPPFSVLFRNSEDFVNAYSQQASLGMERAIASDWLVSLNYIFARTLKIVRARDNNLREAPLDPVLGIRVWSPPFFKRPLLLQDNVYESTGRAFYHALTLELKRRLIGHFGLDANYTLSKAIDEVVDFNSDFQANDQLNLRAERALSSFDHRHRLLLAAWLQSPFQSGQGPLSSVLSNFTLTSVIRAHSARPFNLLTGFDLNQDRHSTTDRPIHAGRNTGIGPNFWTVDLRLTRKINLTEGAALELMAEGFNLLNRMNYRSVNNVVGNIPGPFNLKGRSDVSPSQPRGFTSAFEPRRIQLGVRLNF